MSKNDIETKPTSKDHTVRNGLLVLAVIVAVVTIGALLAKAFIPQLSSRQSTQNTSTSSLNPAYDGNQTKTALEQTVSSVTEKVSPSVVSIVTNIRTQSYFGTSDSQAAGTGIIVSKDGYILTNKHVISGANQIQVIASDGTTYDGVSIVGTDPLNDVAYLKIKGVDNLTPAELGDSSTVRVGQSVVAIGNALGQYQNTVTSGIISGLGRPVDAVSDSTSSAVETLTDLLQTDAAINPGNSGGPLLNMAGQVIGLNTAIAQDAQGIGFSIPINATKGTLKGVLAGNGVKHAYMGLRYVSITAAAAKQYNLPVKAGAYIHSQSSESSVVSGGPAARAGIKEGDIITKINGLIVGKNGDVSSLIGAFSPGESVQITLLRDGKEQSISLTLGTY